MKTPTIYDIKYKVQAKSPYFFSRKTMQFFNQTLRDYRVKTSPAGRVFIYAPRGYLTETGRLVQCGYTFREFTGDDLINPEGYQSPQSASLESIAINLYIDTH